LTLTPELQREWRRFAADVEAAERASAAAEGGFAFAFVEGALVKALKHGWWLLLDEINLAPPEVLERIAGILESAHPAHTAAAAGGGIGGVGGVGEVGVSAAAAAAAGGDDGVDASSGLLLVERGDVSVINRHPGFRLVAAMNPATDAGKRDLPPQLRSRFTEFWVGEPRSREDLCQLVGGYLAGAGPSPPVDQVVSFYLEAKAQAVSEVGGGGGLTVFVGRE
jgi:midasin